MLGFISHGLASFNQKKEIGLKGKLKNADEDLRRNPDWDFPQQAANSEIELNLLLDSFEAVLIEAFTPRFNARGGNLKDAVYVDQLEELPALIRGLDSA